MEQVLQAAALCVTASLLAMVVRRGSPETALLLALGAAAVVLEKDSSGQLLFQTACGILHDDARRAAMAKAMADLGIRAAAERSYQTILEICK